MVVSATLGPDALRTATAPAAAHAAARLWEIDVIRTLAIGLMVVYHVAWDVHMLAPQVDLDPFDGAWRALQVTCASTFLAVVGVSFWVAHQRARRRGLAGLGLWGHHARRGAQVLAAACLVSLATLVALGPDDAVRFGILHLIAAAMLVVLPLTVGLGAWNVVLGVAAILVGLELKQTDTSIDVALILGFDPGETGVDWYGMLPWIGPTLIGVAIGALLYPGGERGAMLSRLRREPLGAGVAGAPGRHSLAIYLVHQPVLIVLTAAALLVTGTEVSWS
jgi:uncharacterized membrane protein